MVYSFEVKSSVDDSTVVPAWQIVKIHDFLAGFTDCQRFPVLASHLGRKRGKTWNYHLLGDREVENARRACELGKCQEALWRAGGRKGEGIFLDAFRHVYHLYKTRPATLAPLGYQPSQQYTFWRSVHRNEPSNWTPTEPVDETLQKNRSRVEQGLESVVAEDNM